MSYLLRFILVLSCGLSAVSQAEWHQAEEAVMGTSISVTVWHEQPSAARKAMQSVIAEMQRIDALWNPDLETSELYLVNHLAVTETVAITDELCRVLDKALYYSKLSNGAFDVTFASVGQYYDYRQGIQPDEQLRTKALSAIDYRLIDLDKENCTVSFKDNKVQIDLGGIAKGYAVDRAIAILQKQGVLYANVSAGGDSRMLGDKQGKPWMVGVKNPRDDEALAVVLPLSDAALSTSGDYERFFVDLVTGERVHHILNPSSGTSSTGLSSVSIIGPQAFDTDPLSTTVFVLGIEAGLELVERLPEFDAILITSNGQLHYSSGLQPPE